MGRSKLVPGEAGLCASRDNDSNGMSDAVDGQGIWIKKVSFRGLFKKTRARVYLGETKRTMAAQAEACGGL